MKRQEIEELKRRAPPEGLPAPARTVDTSGTLCPVPIVELAKAMKGVDAGGVVLVIATDPGVLSDVPMWCRATKNEHLATYWSGRAWNSLVRRAVEKVP